MISVHSSDTQPDSSEERCQSQYPIELLSPVPASVSFLVVESPSHYQAPTEPIVLSAISSVPISPNRVREDCSSITLDVYPVYEVSPDTTGYVPATRPVMLPSSEVCFVAYSRSGASPSGTPPPPPVSLNGVVACDITLLDRSTDLSLLAIPLLPLPDGLLLVPVTASDQPSTSIEHPLPREQLPHVASPRRDLSREGPFDTYCTPSDTGDLRRTAELPYRMTSYASTDITDVDSVYGLQLHHPRFLEFIGASESARFLTRASGHWLRTGTTLSRRLYGSSMMPVSGLPICRSLVILRLLSTACRLRF